MPLTPSLGIQNEEYNRVVVPDGESFLKRGEAQMMIGYDEDKLDRLARHA